VFVDIDVTVLSDSLHSYQHLKAFGNANHLYLDPWNSDTVWFFSSSWIIQRATVEVLLILIMLCHAHFCAADYIVLHLLHNC